MTGSCSSQLDVYPLLYIHIVRAKIGQFTFTGAVVSTMQVANSGSNYLPDGAAELLTPEEIVSAIYGSKMTLVLEEFTLFTTWQIKACLLLFYSQLT